MHAGKQCQARGKINKFLLNLFFFQLENRFRNHSFLYTEDFLLVNLTMPLCTHVLVSEVQLIPRALFAAKLDVTLQLRNYSAGMWY